MDARTMNEPRRQRVPVSGGEVVAWSWPGGSPPALLMHGIGNYGRYWDFLADAVDRRVRLVAPDARGHGESLAPAAGYLPRDFVGDAVAVMDATGLERPIVIGHSMGGMHAAALTLAYPDRVLALVLVDVGPRVEEAGQSRARRLSVERPDRFADEARALAYLHETSPGYSDAVYANRMAWVFKRDEHGGLVWRSSKESLRRILDESAKTSAGVWTLARDISRPVLLVRGTRSPSLSEKTAKEFTRSLKNARLVELDAAHNVPLDRPRELADALLEFARSVARER